jgi:sensor histidine kinase YesM
LRALQGQVNPHFLFNSLALVSYTAAREKASQTEEIVHCLSDLLRYSLRNIATRVTLAQELEIIEHYLTLQKLRFGEQLQTELKVEPDLRQTSIPCMILQPLVENAVIHGVEPLTRPVTIRVQGFPWLKGIMLEIADDGAGIPPAIAEAVNARTFIYNEGKSMLGIQNVIRRLEGEYGDRFAFHLEGEPGRGTRVAMFLPLNR